MKFMVVDDSEVIRTKIAQALKNEDFEIVGSAENGLEAIEQFTTLKPAVVTMDITMPKMDGLQTVEKMVEMDDDVRILVVSALSDKATLIQAMKLGAYGFLCKPFTDLDLFEAIEELIEDIA